MKKNRIEENKTDKHLAEKNQIEKNLIVDRLTVTYGEKLAVDGVSFSLSPGKIYVIVGESGSGKSTLLRTIGGLLTKEGKIVSGDIWMGEQNLIQLSEKEWCEVHGNKMGYIFQNPEQSLSPLAKIGKQFVECQNMHVKTAGKKSKKEILEDAEELLKELRFENPQRVLKSYPFELSGGMCQRVAIALAIMNQPSLLLADEPTSALDVASQDMTIETLLALRKKTDLSILLVTHNMEVARRLADEIGVMYQGRIIESGLPEEIWNDPKEDYTKKLIAAIPQPVKLVLDEG
ncbi:ABC transporter ATP-binding protein [Fusicatenibacter saccharivorans]|jgi:ABC-type dipeptide/oligopeptide/nickel transport system ATPase component|uniref:ABC transporter ATP-binding protein n=1 Tax=Fusicatenibacter saccharivorans TaxID=1150298 RepID=UPI00156D75FB|nr:ABC transporter ATP-binding protein [Fusicatenibacter saccharivorans]NSE27542.1 ABC transporter ATP-binding protein [Fusicatenibacter saccharivorans]